MRGEYLTPGSRGKIRTTKIKAGKWRADCYARDSTGKLRRSQRTGTSEVDATRKLLVSISGTSVSGVKTVSNLLDKWLSQHDGISQSTRERYEGVMRRYLKPTIGDVRIDDLSTPVVNDAVRTIYIDNSPYAARTSRSLLRMACKWGTRMNLLERDFTAEVPLPKERGVRVRAWAPSDEQVNRLCVLLEADYTSPTRYGPRSPSAWIGAELMRTTGARIGEVCAVRWEDIDWDAGTVTYADTIVYEDGKNQLRGHLKNSDPYRISYLPLPMLHLLHKHRKESGPIVAARGGEAMQSGNLRRAWRRVYDAAGIPTAHRVRPHDLRRAVGTKLTAELGIDAASAQLGDTRDITERHYVMPSYRGPEASRDLLR